MTKLLTIDLRSTAPGCSDLVAPLLNLFYMVSRICVPNLMLLRDLSRIFPLTDRTISDEKNIPGYDPEIRKLELRLQLAQLENKTVSLQLSLK